YDRKCRRLGRVEGLNVEGKIDENHAISGDLKIHEMEFAGQLHPRRLLANFLHEGDKLAITDIKCALAGGSIRGQFYAVIPQGKKGGPTIEFKSEVEE